MVSKTWKLSTARSLNWPGAGSISCCLFALTAFLRSKNCPRRCPLRPFSIYCPVGIGFWFFQAPHFRFGYGFLGITLCLLAAPIFNGWHRHQPNAPGLGMLALAALLLYQFVAFITCGKISGLRSLWILAWRYPESPSFRPAGSFTLYLPLEGDQCWYTLPLYTCPFSGCIRAVNSLRMVFRNISAP